MNKAFSKIWIVIVLVVIIIGVILSLRYQGGTQESIPEGLTEEEVSQAVECIKDRSYLKSRLCQIDLGKRTASLKICDYIDSFDVPIGFPYPSYCRGGVAAAKKDFSVCENPGLSDFQQNTCYQGIAIALNDKSICNEMKKGGFTSKQAARDSCYEELSVARGNLSECLAVSSHKLNCYSGLAATKEDLSFCDKLSGSEKENCLYKTVIVNPFSKSICKVIENLPKKESCYAEVAKAEKDLTICKEHAPTDYCYQGVAIKTRDFDLCNLISDEQDRKKCTKVIKEIRDFEKRKGVSF